MICDALRDTLLSNLDAIPDAWGGEEVRKVILDVCEGMVDDLGPVRQAAYEKVFFSHTFDSKKDPPDARFETVRGYPVVVVEGRKYPVEETE
jgi:hypothetical protein